MVGFRLNTSILFLTSVFVLFMGCGIATGITFYIFTANECGGADLDKSCEVSFTDFAILARYWLESNCYSSNNCGGADLIYNNGIDKADLRLFAKNWLCTYSGTMNIELVINNLWMYQNLPGATKSNLIANVAITNDPLSNSSYSYVWEIVLPSDVSLGPDTLNGGETDDTFWCFAALNCNQVNGISDSGQVFKVIVTVRGNDYNNTGTAEQEFGIAVLGDVNNDGIVDLADRSIINAFWRTGSAGPFTLRDCDLNCDGTIDVADRSIANALWQGTLCKNEVSFPITLR